jgi:hypothetical protein
MWIAARDMAARDIAEGECGLERDASAGIVAAHDAGHIVTGGIEPFDRMTIGVKGACVLVGPDAGISIAMPSGGRLTRIIVARSRVPPRVLGWSRPRRNARKDLSISLRSDRRNIPGADRE